MTIPEPDGQVLVSTAVRRSSRSPPNSSLERSASEVRPSNKARFGGVFTSDAREDVDLAWTLKIDGYL